MCVREPGFSGGNCLRVREVRLKVRWAALGNAVHLTVVHGVIVQSSLVFLFHVFLPD